MLTAQDGELDEAEKELTALIDKLERDQSAPGAAHNSSAVYELCRCLINRASVRSWAVKPRETMQDLERAELLARKQKPFIRRSLLINILQSKVDLLSSRFSPLCNQDEARRQIFALRAEEPEEWMIATAEMRLAQEERNWPQVIAQGERVVGALNPLGLIRGVNAARNAVARAWLALGNARKAEPLAKEAALFFKENGPPEATAQSALALARARGNEASWPLAEGALKLTEQFVRTQRGVFNQQRMLVEKLQIFSDALRFALQLIECAQDKESRRTAVARAWEVAERSKSFSLRQAMTQGGWLQTLDPQRAAAFEKIDERLDALEAQSDNPEAVQKLSELYEERARMIEAALAESPQVALTQVAPAFDLEAMLAALPTAVGSISWYWLEEPDSWHLHIFFAGKDRVPRHLNTCWSVTEVGSLNAACQRQVSGRPFQIQEALPSSLAPKVFPRELLSALCGCDMLLLTPHRHLRQMPLHAARVADLDKEGGGCFLIERYAVQVLPTFALRFPVQTTSSDRQHVLLIGCARDNFKSPELTDVPLELKALNQTWSACNHSVRHNLVAQEDDLSAHTPLSCWRKFEVIHLACHGAFTPLRPLDAALLLGREKVRATEFFAVRLNARVICLSACDLGQHAEKLDGLELVGDEWLGLALPLFQVGARAILSSLWQANSGVARDFMQAFHEELACGATVARAHQRACGKQLELRQPFGFWANWQLAGFPESSLCVSVKQSSRSGSHEQSTASI